MHYKQINNAQDRIIFIMMCIFNGSFTGLYPSQATAKTHFAQGLSGFYALFFFLMFVKNLKTLHRLLVFALKCLFRCVSTDDEKDMCYVCVMLCVEFTCIINNVCACICRGSNSVLKAMLLSILILDKTVAYVE